MMVGILISPMFESLLPHHQTATVSATAQCLTIGLCSSRCKVSFCCLGTTGALYKGREGSRTQLL